MYIQVSSAHPCYLVNEASYEKVDLGDGFNVYNTGELLAVKPHHPIMLKVPRDKERLRMVFERDSLRTTVLLESKLSWVYYLNIGAMYPIPGMGFIVDASTPKKYEYPNDIFVDILHPDYNATRHSSLKPNQELEPPTRVIFSKDSLKHNKRKDL
jgi:hypothetical protein